MVVCVLANAFFVFCCESSINMSLRILQTSGFFTKNLVQPRYQIEVHLSDKTFETNSPRSQAHVLKVFSKMGKKSTQNLGKALIRSKRAPGFTGKSTRHTTDVHDDPGKSVIQSITEQSALSDFLSTAELSNREFTAEKLKTTIINPSHVQGILNDEELEEIKVYQDKNKELLNIPRRPPWDKSTSAEELEAAERESFLEWRRQLALLDEKDDKLVLTPYEKNIDVWRQLWRVIERSDVLCQIVDARNPLMFKCDDLEKYVQEVDIDKENIILVNKADYLTERQRKYWALYFESKKITVLFWSALVASLSEKNLNSQTSDSEPLDEENMEAEWEPTVRASVELVQREDQNNCLKDVLIGENEDDDVSNDMDEDEESKNDASENESMNIEKDESLQKTETCECTDGVTGTLETEKEACHSDKIYPLLSREDLLEYFKKLKRRKCPDREKIVIGMVGFPNVGKSSTINALLGTKKTSVSSTPGKTKHFQTINISDDICLCDCPGLVFPTFVSTKAEMILNGILPVDQMRDYRPPTTLLCKLIPRRLLEIMYGINIPLPEDWEDPSRAPTADEFLSAYARMRGFMTSHNMPDCSRGSRYVIKDFLNGKLLYCEPPPQVEKGDFEPATVPLPKLYAVRDRENTGQKQKTTTSNIDREFFAKKESSIHYNAPSGVRPLVGGMVMQEGKPWKRHYNRNKKEKIRRVKNN